MCNLVAPSILQAMNLHIRHYFVYFLYIFLLFGPSRFYILDGESKAKTKKDSGKGKGKKKKQKGNDKEALEDSDDGDYEGLEVDYMSEESRSDH